MLQGKEKKIKDKRKKLCLELAEGIKGLSAISRQLVPAVQEHSP